MGGRGKAQRLPVTLPLAANCRGFIGYAATPRVGTTQSSNAGRHLRRNQRRTASNWEHHLKPANPDPMCVPAPRGLDFRLLRICHFVRLCRRQQLRKLARMAGRRNTLVSHLPPEIKVCWQFPRIRAMLLARDDGTDAGH